MMRDFEIHVWCICVVPKSCTCVDMFCNIYNVAYMLDCVVGNFGFMS